MGIQSLTLKCIARVFSLKISLEKLLTISWIMWVYIVLVKVWEKTHLKRTRQWVSRATHDLAWAAKRHVKPSLAWDSSDSSMFFSRGLLQVVSHKLVTNYLSSLIFTKLSHTILTLNLTINTGKWLNKNTIKFDIELKPT